MKKYVLFVILIGFFACKTQYTASKNQNTFHAYEVSYDGEGRKILRGLITRADIERDTAFSWFKKNYTLGKPDANTVKVFKQHGKDFHLLVFGGTWCSDTQNLLPQLYQLADASEYADSNITLIGVDHAKTTLDNLDKTFHVVDVPTFIVMKDGKEVGRVVEYGESGEAMKELGNIAAGL